MPFCWFCHAAAHFMVVTDDMTLSNKSYNPKTNAVTHKMKICLVKQSISKLYLNNIEEMLCLFSEVYWFAFVSHLMHYRRPIFRIIVALLAARFYTGLSRKQNEPSHEIMALFVLRKLILETCMCSHPVGLDV